MSVPMINFRSVTWQNFLSTGNTPIEIVLDKVGSTLIIGENGSGKSTVLDALCFGLFGKPFRRIKKDQLVNSVNERDCKVDISILSLEVSDRIDLKFIMMVSYSTKMPVPKTIRNS